MVQSNAPSPAVKSKILDGNGKISIGLILKYRDTLQSGTTTRSEQVFKVNPKFVIENEVRMAAEDKDGEEIKMSVKEASHRVRIAQGLLPGISSKQPKKDRENRWKTHTAVAIRAAAAIGGMIKLCLSSS